MPCATRFVRVFVAVASLVAVTGCTGAADTGAGRTTVDRGAFAEGYRTVTDEYQSEVDRIQRQGQTAAQNDPKQVAEVFDALRQATEQAHRRYVALRPPSDLEEPHAALLENLDGQSAALRRIAAGTRAQTPDPEALSDLAGLLGDYAATQQMLAERLAEDG